MEILKKADYIGLGTSKNKNKIIPMHSYFLPNFYQVKAKFKKIRFQGQLNVEVRHRSFLNILNFT